MLDKLMVQQQLKAPYKRWKHMVAVMCLNLTYRKQVKTVLPLLFEKYPTPLAYLKGRLKTQQKIFPRARRYDFSREIYNKSVDLCMYRLIYPPKRG